MAEATIAWILVKKCDLIYFLFPTHMEVVPLPLELRGGVDLVSHDAGNGLHEKGMKTTISNMDFN